jgi:hypothetical protein
MIVSEVTTDTLLHTGKGRIYALLLTPVGATTLFEVYDALTATGAPIASLQTVTAAGPSVSIEYPHPHLSYATGLHVELVNGSGSLFVYHEPW